MLSPVISLFPVAAASKKSRSKEELRPFLATVDHVPPRNMMTTSRWIAAIRERWGYLKETVGLNQYDLEEWMGASQAALSSLLGHTKRGVPEYSPHVERLSLSLGVPVDEGAIAMLTIKAAADVGVPDDTMRGAIAMLNDAIDRLEKKK